jgi:hypothetical protein
MNNEIYLIEYKNKIIGAYLDYNLAEIFLISCIQNNLMDNNIRILVFNLNSCYNKKIINFTANIYPNKNDNYIEEYINESYCEKSADLISVTSSTKDLNMNLINTINNLGENDEKICELAKKKKKIMHKINIIKYNKNKIDEYKNLFLEDKKLFEKFNNLIKNDISFQIPELFKDKYNVFIKLLNDNNLNFDSFINEYYNNNFYTDKLILDKSSVTSDNNTIDEFEISSLS